MAKYQNAVALSTKIAIIDAVEPGNRSKSEMAEMFNLPKSTKCTLSTILKSKVKLHKMLNLFQMKLEMKLT